VATEVELKERKHRIEDAVRNAKTAVEHGILAGGGVALLQAGAGLFEGLGLDGDDAHRREHHEVALEAPLKQIAINAGLEGDVMVETVRSLTPGEGQPEISYPSRLRALTPLLIVAAACWVAGGPPASSTGLSGTTRGLGR
jgi:chaperonin GroEL (HSP60 family)